MYERSVIVLERYMEDILGLNKQNNLKNNFYTYKEMVEEMKVYQNMLEEEEDVLQKFDEIANKLQKLQKNQEILYKENEIAEKQRNDLFSDLDIRPDILEKRLIRIESQIDQNNDQLKQVRRDYVEALEVFIERQKNSNVCARKKKGTDANHLATIKKTKQLFEMIDIEDLKRMKNFVDGDKSLIKEQIFNIMMENGKNERVSFNEQVIKTAIDVRMDIATREAKCYIILYDKLRKLLREIENDNLLLSKYEKTLRDVGVKLRFFEVEKDYIVGFLDNERMTAINGEIIHEKMMKEACNNFEKDIIQIDNLYELIRRETLGKASDEDYNELYNKTYLRDIEETAKNFEKQITNVSINVGAVINSNYWRIQGIKNIYIAFKEEISEKFDKDLSVYEEESVDEGYEIEQLKDEDDESKKSENYDEIYDEDDELGDLGIYEHEDELDFNRYNKNNKYGKSLNSLYNNKKDNIIEHSFRKEDYNKKEDEEKRKRDEEDDEEFKLDTAYDSIYKEKMLEIEEKKKKEKIKNLRGLEGSRNFENTKKRKIRKPSILKNYEKQNKIDEFMQNISEEEDERREKENFINKLLKFNKDRDRALKNTN